MAGALEVHIRIQLYDAVDPAPDGRYNVERRVADMSMFYVPGTGCPNNQHAPVQLTEGPVSRASACASEHTTGHTAQRRGGGSYGS